MNFYHRFLPRCANLMQPLHILVRPESDTYLDRCSSYLLSRSNTLYIAYCSTSLVGRAHLYVFAGGVAFDYPAPPSGLVGVLRFARFEQAGAISSSWPATNRASLSRRCPSNTKTHRLPLVTEGDLFTSWRLFPITWVEVGGKLLLADVASPSPVLFPWLVSSFFAGRFNHNCKRVPPTRVRIPGRPPFPVSL